MQDLYHQQYEFNDFSDCCKALTPPKVPLVRTPPALKIALPDPWDRDLGFRDFGYRVLGFRILEFRV